MLCFSISIYSCSIFSIIDCTNPLFYPFSFKYHPSNILVCWSFLTKINKNISVFSDLEKLLWVAFGKSVFYDSNPKLLLYINLVNQAGPFLCPPNWSTTCLCIHLFFCMQSILHALNTKTFEVITLFWLFNAGNQDFICQNYVFLGGLGKVEYYLFKDKNNLLARSRAASTVFLFEHCLLNLKVQIWWVFDKILTNNNNGFEGTSFLFVFCQMKQQKEEISICFHCIKSWNFVLSRISWN